MAVILRLPSGQVYWKTLTHGLKEVIHVRKHCLQTCIDASSPSDSTNSNSRFGYSPTCLRYTLTDFYGGSIRSRVGSPSMTYHASVENCRIMILTDDRRKQGSRRFLTCLPLKNFCPCHECCCVQMKSERVLQCG